MRRILKAVGAKIRRVFEVLSRLEQLIEYRYEDYAEDRFKRLEERLAILEGRPRPDRSKAGGGGGKAPRMA